jgi:DNA processing protein
MGGVSDEILLARAFLSRVAEPASVPLWAAVRRYGPVEVVRGLTGGTGSRDLHRAAAARLGHVDPVADLEAAARHDIRLVVPESDDWPHFALSALEATGERRVAEWEAGRNRSRSRSGDLVPPLALWVRGSAELSPVGTRSVAVVGARAATPYGEQVAKDFAFRLAERGFAVVSGGAYGIDAVAHKAALAAGGETILVSAGGLDQPYPPGNAGLYDRVAASGLVISESPPGAAPQRRRFLTRNRLIACLASGTVVVEAATRSGARNTAGHAVELGRPVMAVPGPITSPQSAGCHQLLAAERSPARLVTSVNDVLEVLGAGRDVLSEPDPERQQRFDLRDRLEALDLRSRQVFDGFPARGWIGPQELALTSGVPPLDVLRALPVLEIAGLVEASVDGYRIVRADRAHRGSSAADGGSENAGWVNRM